MENKLAHMFCNYLCRSNIVSYELYDVYVYGMELVLSFLTSTVLILCIGIISDALTITLVHLLVFILVRRFTGGYHANTYIKCKIITVGTYVAVLIFSRVIDINILCYTILAVIGLITISKWGPVENPNKPLNEDEKRSHRRRAIVLFVIFVVCGSVFTIYKQPLGNAIFFSLSSIIALMLITKFMKGEDVNEKENC